MLSSAVPLTATGAECGTLCGVGTLQGVRTQGLNNSSSYHTARVPPSRHFECRCSCWPKGFQALKGACKARRGYCILKIMFCAQWFLFSGTSSCQNHPDSQSEPA